MKHSFHEDFLKVLFRVDAGPRGQGWWGSVLETRLARLSREHAERIVVADAFGYKVRLLLWSVVLGWTSTVFLFCLLPIQTEAYDTGPVRSDHGKGPTLPVSYRETSRATGLLWKQARNLNRSSAHGAQIPAKERAAQSHQGRG